MISEQLARSHLAAIIRQSKAAQFIEKCVFENGMYTVEGDGNVVIVDVATTREFMRQLRSDPERIGAACIRRRIRIEFDVETDAGDPMDEAMSQLEEGRGYGHDPDELRRQLGLVNCTAEWVDPS